MKSVVNETVLLKLGDSRQNSKDLLNSDICNKKMEKKVILNHTRLPPSTSREHTFIDLTTSVDESPTKKIEFVETPSKIKTSFEQSILDSSDIIDSSIIESNAIDNDGFRIPSVNSVQPGPSKTLSVYKRSSLMTSVLNEEACITKDEKVKTEKFDKLKEHYIKLRDVHIQKIREIAEVEKKLDGALKKLEKLNELESEKERLEHAVKQKSAELSILQKDKDLFNMETEILKKSLTDACKESDTIKLEISYNLQEMEELKKKSEELSYKILDLERQLDNGRYCNCPKCKVSRESTRCITGKRFSVKIVPATPSTDSIRETSILENYALNAGYVPDQILEDTLENNIRSLSLNERKTSVVQNSAPVTARELVLRRCGQTEPLPFEECYPKRVLRNCQSKIGEGMYGEVFLFRNPNGGTSVIKVIPIEGDRKVNGNCQKKFEDILSEIVIAMELSNLRNKKQNTTSGFGEIQKILCVQGSYPEKLLNLWNLYDKTRESENDSPERFGEDQLYIVLQLANGGQDLQAFVFNNSLQAYTTFQQVALTLAVAEEELRFEHRDLHWGNILLSVVDKNKKQNYQLNGKNYEIMTNGVEATIIDSMLSRIECDGVVLFNDLSLEPDLFTAEGDYQFEVYKLMQKKNGNNWKRFEPYTNILWLHYILDKAIAGLHYTWKETKQHEKYMSKLKHLKNEILNYNSAKDFILINFRIFKCKKR